MLRASRSAGPGLLKLWRLQESNLKGFNLVSGKAASHNFTDHSWAPGDRLLASTDLGDVLVVEQGELRSTVKTRMSGTPIYTIVAYSSGFIVAGSEVSVTPLVAPRGLSLQCCRAPYFVDSNGNHAQTMCEV